MYKVGSNKPPVSSSSDTSVSSTKPTTASASFQERTVSVAGQQQSASFLPSSDVQQHSPIASSERKPKGPRKFAIVEGASMSTYEQVTKLRPGRYEQSPALKKPASASQYSTLQFESKKQSEDTPRSTKSSQSAHSKGPDYDYPYTEIKLKPRPGGDEYSKLKHDRGNLDPEPKPIVRPEDPWAAGSKQNVRRQRYGSIPLELGKRGKRADQLAKMQGNPEPATEEYVDMAAQTGRHQQEEYVDMAAQTGRHQQEEYVDMAAQTGHHQQEEYVDMAAQTGRHRQDVSAAKQRMSTPPPPERPPKASAEPEQPLTPPPIPKRPPKSSSASETSMPPLPPRPSHPSAPPSLYTRTDKPSEPPPLPPRTNQNVAKPQSQDVRQQTAATSESDVHDKSKKTEN